VVTAALLLWAVRGHRESPPRAPVATHGRTEIAVLPFQNLSAAGPHAYFAGGSHDELLTQLAKVASLKTISRTSVMGYANTTKPLKEIATELGVGSIVEGSVQVEGQRLRVNVQLIDAATDEHLWAERYDRTLDDAFAIQSDVAQRVVAAVGAALTGDEGRAIAEAPTANAEAYRLYLQAAENRPASNTREGLEAAQRLFERALALDPDFALAHARLSRIHGAMLWYGYDASPPRIARQLAEAEAALRLAPQLPQAHWAMGLVHYWGHRDYRGALDEFRIALAGMPNDAELWRHVGYVERRLGHWAATDSAYHRALRLDPRNADCPYDLGGNTYLVTRRYADAAHAFDLALALAPHHRLAGVQRGRTYLYWKGDLDTLRSVLAGMPTDADLGGGVSAIATHALMLLYERKADSLLALLPGAHGEGAEMFEPSLYAAWAHRLRGDEHAAHVAFASALKDLATASDAGGFGYYVHAQRGAALAGLGRRAEALKEVRWLRRSRICREDHFDAGPQAGEASAFILVELGESDAALDEIERLLAGPSSTSVHTLRLDPRWDPIREQPRFKALLVKYANPEKWAVR